MSEIFNDILVIVFSLFFVAEVSPPKKVKPITYILRWLGKALNVETTKTMFLINEKVETLSKRVESLENEERENRRKYLSIAISNFASELRHNEIKGESQFDSIIELCDEYFSKGYNGKIKLEAEFIKNEYLEIGNKVKKRKYKMEE